MHDNAALRGAEQALWHATAVASPETTALTGDRHCDVAVVGAGFTGLNAALYLARENTAVTVLEAGALGAGSSGRSGGQVNLGLNLGPRALLKHFGHATGERMLASVAQAPDHVFETVRRYSLDCDPVRAGWVQAATSPASLERMRQLADEYAAYGVHFEILDRTALQRRTGATRYVGGLYCPTAGSLHPLSYTRELARASLAHGAQVHTRSAVTGIERKGDRWLLHTGEGRLSCTQVLLCTNAYTGSAIPGLQQKVVPVRSVLAATEPLPAPLRERILPGQITFVDKRRLILYCRYDRDGRLCVGDHGPARDHFRPADFDAIKRRAEYVFPSLAGIRWDFHWGGRVAMTRNALPFIYRCQPGVLAGMGFNGRGVAMGSQLGRILARLVLGMPAGQAGFPVTEPRSFPLHRFHAAGVSIAVKWYTLLDHIENTKHE